MLSQILGVIGALFHRNVMTEKKKKSLKCFVNIIPSNDLRSDIVYIPVYVTCIDILIVFIVLLGAHIHCFVLFSLWLHSDQY